MGVCCAHLLPNVVVVVLLGVLLVEVDNVHRCLGVLLLLLLCNAVLLQHALPFLGETLNQVSYAP
jgi:hypothetical protein